MPTKNRQPSSETLPNPPTTVPKEEGGSSTGGVPPVPAHLVNAHQLHSEKEHDPPLPKTPAEGNGKDEEDGREYFVSELVYIHDKLLIVDDRIVLVGSGISLSFLRTFGHLHLISQYQRPFTVG